ncbi:hypothetical protein AMELA_G00138340 [Ameiurus melas]|uniref:Uncharacterized protein n=1 Tax=Ameiurus melas TaxID=219545 RepID=A0A7J6AKT9_AMEME|nr:hypothetical protein AMELA_G00138340 [Ameiurus melas]
MCHLCLLPSQQFPEFHTIIHYFCKDLHFPQAAATYRATNSDPHDPNPLRSLAPSNVSAGAFSTHQLPEAR